MPKKRSYNFKTFTTSNNSRSAPNDGEPSSQSTRTVNERLAQLRAEQTPRPTIEQRDDFSTLSTSHTLPPNLRRILQIPETGPLPPRNRRLARINGRRPPPGPAAPMSWLAGSGTYSRGHQPRSDRSIQEECGCFSRLAMLDGPHALPDKGSLMDQTLKTMARHWEFVAEYEQYNLSTMPVRWKTALLSYLGIYGPEAGITAGQLKTLFKPEEDMEDATGGDDLVRLDLTRLLTQSFSLQDFERLLYRKVEASDCGLEAQVAQLTVQTNSGISPKRTSGNIVAESWEVEAEASAPQITPGLRIKRFPDLTRLSLAHAGKYASWQGLLSVAAHTPTLTHLSLAYWPRPTLTPNAINDFITHNHASIPVSGSHIYASLDDDWTEPANILKRLSNLTYCLEWLDLEGCGEWLPALSWRCHQGRTRDRWIDRTFGPSSTAESANAGQLPDALETSQAPNDAGFVIAPAPSTVPGPDWTGSWSQVTYLNFSQPLIPRDVNAIRAYPAGVLAAELLQWLRDHAYSTEDDIERTKGMDIPGWLRREKEARSVESKIRELRRSVGGLFCDFDYGWKRKVPKKSIVGKKGEDKDVVGEGEA